MRLSNECSLIMTVSGLADYAKDVSVSIFILKEALGESKLSLERYSDLRSILYLHTNH